MKKLTLALLLGFLVISTLHAQQAVVIERPGVLTDLASAAGAIVALPLAAVGWLSIGAKKSPKALPIFPTANSIEPFQSKKTGPL